MENDPIFPAIDSKKLTSAFLRSSQPSSDSPELRIAVSAEQVRQLAHKRIRLALFTLPSCLLLGAAALLISLSLALVAVLCGFFAYACITIAKRQRDTVKAAADFEVAVSGNQFHAAGRSPRQIFMAVQRPDYLRLVLTRERVSALWLDDRRNPDALFDLPTTKDSRLALAEALRAAGVTVRKEGSAQRVVVLLGSIAVALFAFGAVRVALKWTATMLLGSPLALVFFGVVVVGIWWSRQPGE